MNKNFKKYLITTVIGVFVTVYLLFSLGLFENQNGPTGAMLILADSFSVVGIIMLSVGALIFVSTEGVFDSISYMGKFIARALIPGWRKTPLDKYGDYKVAKSEHRLSGYAFILIVGLGFTVVGGVFTVLYFVV